jgi:hypothetical protein
MKLNKREKILAGTVGGIVLLAVVVGLWQYGFAGGKSFAELQAEYNKLALDLDKDTKRCETAKIAAGKLEEWQRRALPADTKIAEKLYENWLLALMRKAGWEKWKKESNNPTIHRGVGEEFSITINGAGTLPQLTQFLFEFYQAGHLHKISHLTIKPLNIGKSKDLDIAITITALSLADADRRDELTKMPGNRLQKKAVSEYSTVIVGRNIFAPPEPPKPEGPKITTEIKKDTPPPPKFDHLEFTKLTGITESDGRPLAWIETKTTGKEFKVREGDEVDIASAKVKVLRIGTRDIELQIGDEKRTIGLGQNLLGKQKETNPQ